MKGQIKIGKKKIHSTWRLFRCFLEDDGIIKAMFCDTKSDDEVWFDLDEEAQKNLYSTLKDKFEVDPALLKNKELRKLLTKPNFKPNMPATEFLEAKESAQFYAMQIPTSTAEFPGSRCYLDIVDEGDPSAGILSQTWRIECPFFYDTDLDPELWNFFKEEQLKVYGEFSEGKLKAEFITITDACQQETDSLPIYHLIKSNKMAILSGITAGLLKSAGFPQPDKKYGQIWYGSDGKMWIIGQRFKDDDNKAICADGTTWEHLHDTNGFVFCPTVDDIMKDLPLYSLYYDERIQQFVVRDMECDENISSSKEAIAACADAWIYIKGDGKTYIPSFAFSGDPDAPTKLLG